jgi:hypothetical protein
MSNGTPALETRVLTQLAELGLGMAQRLHDVALATDDPEQVAALGTAYHQVSRGVRQSLALQARFAAGSFPAERAVRPAAPSPTPLPATRVETERTGWDEYERPDCNESLDELLEELDGIADLPEGERLDIVRAERAIEAGLARIRSDLTAVSRTPALAAMPALRPQAAKLAGRAALLGGAAALRVVNSS